MPSEMMIRRLRVHSKLNEDDAAALRSVSTHVKEFQEDTVFVRESEWATHCCVILSGFAYRAKVTENGKRQILSFHPAGDMPDLQGLYLDRMDHDLVTLSRARVGFIEHRSIQHLIETRPSIMQALWRETLVDAAVFREWIVSLGTRTAAGRMAHLIAELRQRLTAVGIEADDEFEFPITQSKLAEALGLSPVHVNRVLQSLRAEGVLDIQKNMVKLRDIEKLVEIGGFNDTYLHQQ
ncbi:Crp/Fnr family transcriptional regulator [Bradyrhizobium sp. Ai1a-2]|uniref:Crp/Fnr family transcriptional regulator n=1 Tax=Bradyrhizobium sp. Ai1a-2 TaxID=196490 RepID=UPI00041C8F75|nr:Crp/Fnr family transcriptional regulator [Bradyrhizobium sp. Ai1a-2]